MDTVLEQLNRIENLIQNQAIYAKEVLNFHEACSYLELSESHLYKLTSADAIPFYKPNGKKLYFKRTELNKWLLRNRNVTEQDLEDKTFAYLANKKQVKSWPR